MAETGKVQKLHGCFGCSILVILVVLFSIAASLTAAIRTVRYANGVALECGNGQMELPSFQQVVYIIAPDNCWTDWIEFPKGSFGSITADSTIDEELLFSDGTSQVFQNFPGKKWPPLAEWTKLRFKNSSNASIRITIRVRN